MNDDRKLEKYRRKRDLSKSPEPAGGELAKGDKPIFVVQKHKASSLHYDFRIEIDGVLKSWAVPKGPSMKPSVKRLAIPTEDHPMEYADFEGTIPEGEYGAGVVQLWDRGSYDNIKEKDGDEVPVTESYDNGQVEVDLEGEKLMGGFALIRTGGGSDERWLLIKMRDENADPDVEPTEEMNRSVMTDRTMEEIKQEGE